MRRARGAPTVAGAPLSAGGAPLSAVARAGARASLSGGGAPGYVRGGGCGDTGAARAGGGGRFGSLRGLRRAGGGGRWRAVAAVDGARRVAAVDGARRRLRRGGVGGVVEARGRDRLDTRTGGGRREPARPFGRAIFIADDL
nr:uncharacterized protein LOC127303630 [Lolium perenne]